jgi:hypothetical protein
MERCLACEADSVGTMERCLASAFAKPSSAVRPRRNMGGQAGAIRHLPDEAWSTRDP